MLKGNNQFRKSQPLLQRKFISEALTVRKTIQLIDKQQAEEPQIKSIRLKNEKIPMINKPGNFLHGCVKGMLDLMNKNDQEVNRNYKEPRTQNKGVQNKEIFFNQNKNIKRYFRKSKNQTKLEKPKPIPRLKFYSPKKQQRIKQEQKSVSLSSKQNRRVFRKPPKPKKNAQPYRIFPQEGICSQLNGQENLLHGSAYSKNLNVYCSPVRRKYSLNPKSIDSAATKANSSKRNSRERSVSRYDSKYQQSLVRSRFDRCSDGSFMGRGNSVGRRPVNYNFGVNYR